MIQVYPVLRQQMQLHGVSYRELAVIADTNTFDVILKMSGIRRWTLPEVVRICCFFRNPNSKWLFLRNNHTSLFRKSQHNFQNIQDGDLDV